MESLSAGWKTKNKTGAGRFLALALCLLASPSWAASHSRTVSLAPAQVFQGGIVRITVSGEDLEEVGGFLQNRSIAFFPAQAGVYFALLGVDLEQKPGPLEITVRSKSKDKEKWERSVLLRIKKKAFAREELTVPPSFDRIDEAARKRIEKEQETLDRLWALATPRRLWDGGFLQPLPGGISSPFGLRRVINGYPRSPHGGVDLKASLGAEVRAANHGRVVLREEFFFSGKSIVLDHGGGLFTMYFHLSDFAVEQEGLVRKGDVIGRAGMSGRVTGPHLHWGARLNGARVDPFELLGATGNGQQAVGEKQ